MKTGLTLSRRTVLTLIILTILAEGVLSAIFLRGSLSKTLTVENTKGEIVSLKPTDRYRNLMELNPLIEGVFSEDIDKPVGVVKNLHASTDDGTIIVRSYFDLADVEEFFRIWFFTHIELNQYPTICILLHVNRTIAIHIRVTGIYSLNGSTVVNHIWLDQAFGGIYRSRETGELRCANVADLFYSLTGFKDLVVTGIVIKVIDRYVNVGFFELRLVRLIFASSYVDTEYKEPSRVILIRLDPHVNLEEWDLTSIRIYYRVKGLGKGEFNVFGVYWRNRLPLVGKSYIHILANEEKYVATTIYYNSFRPYGYLQELSNITLSDFGELFIVILSSSEFEFVSIDYILLFFEKSPYTYPSLYRVDAVRAGFMLIAFVILIYVLPASVFILTRFVFLRHNSVPVRAVLLMIALALLTRLPLMLFTGHSFDMEIWKMHARTYYEDGKTYFEAWPTTPIYYYVLILSYSFYALTRTFGFRDYKFMAHTFNVVEGFFIKLPFVIADMASFYAILKILNADRGGDSSGLEVNTRSLLYASLFLFNPLSILVSSAWGMYDPLALCLSLWSLYYLYVKRKTWVAAFLGTLAGLTKPFGFLTLIPVVVSHIRGKDYRSVLVVISLFTSLVVLTYLPMFHGGFHKAYRFNFIERLFSVSGGVVSWRGLGLYNLSTMAYPLIYVSALLVVILWYSLKGINSIIRFAEFASIVLITHYLTFRVVYVQHTLWILPFIIIISFFKGTDVKLKLLLIGIASIIYAWSAMTPGYLITGVPSLWNNLLVLKSAAWGYLALLASTVAILVLLSRRTALKWLKQASDLSLVSIYVATYLVGCFV